MQTAADSKKMSDKFLNTDEGQLKGIIDEIVKRAGIGDTDIEVEEDVPISKYTEGRLKELGYKVAKNKVSW